MASDTDTATPEPGRRFGLQDLRARIAAALGHRDEVPPRAASAETPSLLRRRRSATRRYSPLTRRILLLNIIPVALLTLGAVYLSDYEEELIDAELASLAVQGEMVAAGIGEVAVAGGETTVNRLDADAARQLLTRLVRPTGVRARLFSETGELLGDSSILSDAMRSASTTPAPGLEKGKTCLGRSDSSTRTKPISLGLVGALMSTTDTVPTPLPRPASSAQLATYKRLRAGSSDRA